MSFQFIPQSGPAGTPVTLILDDTGTFITSVTFNGVSSPFTTDGSGVVNTSVPIGATTGLIRVNFFGGSSVTAPFPFTVVSAPSTSTPSITSISPTSGAGGTLVTLFGSSLQNITSASINNVTCLLQSVLATQVVVSMPGSGTSGPIVLAGSTGSASSPNFTYAVNANAPQVTSFTPSSGTVGTSVTITGLRFLNASQVMFNGIGVSFTIDSDTQIRAMAPENAGTGRITVVNAFGSGTSTANFSYTNTLGAPSISSFSPTSGKAGDLITLNGLNLGALTQIKFNGVSASFSNVSGTQVKATVPPGATTGLITVVNALGQGSSATAFTVTTPAALPSVSFFNPASGSPGTPVQINGSGFAGATSVVFANGKAADAFTVSNGNLIFTTVPLGAVTGGVSITTPVGSQTSGVSFFVNTAASPPPSITSFTPASGGGGLSVDILGTHFVQVQSVQFGGKPATYTLISATLIRARVPFDAVTGPIRVTTAGGVAASATSFRFISLAPSPPLLFSFSPISGAVGTEVTLNGSNLSSVTEVKLGGVTCTPTVLLDQQIRFNVPSNSLSGFITVTGPGGTASTGSSFNVTGGAVPPPTNTGNGKLKFRTQRGPGGGNFQNELPPKFTMELGIDDAGKVLMVAGQEIAVGLLATRDDDNADTVELFLTEDKTISFNASLSKTVVNTFEDFDVNIASPTSALPTIGKEFSVGGTGTIPPPLPYSPFSIRVEVLAAAQVVPNENTLNLSRSSSAALEFVVIRRRFISATAPVLENLPAGVSVQSLALLGSQRATPEEGGGIVDRYKATLTATSTATLGLSNVRIHQPATGGTPSDVKPMSGSVTLKVLEGIIRFNTSGPIERSLSPGQSDMLDIMIESLSYAGQVKLSGEVEVVSGDGMVPPTFTIFYDETQTYLPGTTRNGSISISAPQNASVGSYSLSITGSNPDEVFLNIISFEISVETTRVVLEPAFPTSFSLYPGELRIFRLNLRRAQSFDDPIRITPSELPTSLQFSTLPNFPGPDDLFATASFQAGATTGGGVSPFSLTPKLLLGDQNVGPRLALELRRLPLNLSPLPSEPTFILQVGDTRELSFILQGTSFLAPDDKLAIRFDPPIAQLQFTKTPLIIDNPRVGSITLSVKLTGRVRSGIFKSRVVFDLSSSDGPRNVSLPSQPVSFEVIGSDI